METLQAAIRAEEQALRPLYGFLFEGSTRRSVFQVIRGSFVPLIAFSLVFCVLAAVLRLRCYQA